MAIPKIILAFFVFSVACGFTPLRQEKVEAVEITVAWDQHLITSRTEVSILVDQQPPMYEGSPTYDAIWTTLREMSGNYVRYCPWYPYPKYAIAELEPPVIKGDHCSTSWNFTLMDQGMEAFFANTPNVKRALAITESPDWMWITNTSYTYPHNVSEIDFAYNNGTRLRDPTFKEISEYFARIVSWYTAGGFTDECGIYHQSAHHYYFDIFEILEEIEFEHELSVEYYTEIYDVMVSTIQPITPSTKFLGLNNAYGQNLTYPEYFLNRSNHKIDVPIDYIAIHLYGSSSNETEGPATCYAQMDHFINETIPAWESIRDQLSPETEFILNEAGTILLQQAQVPNPNTTIPEEYWVWSGGVWAYLWSNALLTGIPFVAESQLSGVTGNFPDVSLVNQTTGGANARGRVLELIQTNFGLGDDAFLTRTSNATSVFAQGFITAGGHHKLLVINKDAQSRTVTVPGFDCGTAHIVDLTTQSNVWRTEYIHGCTWEIPAYGTAVLTAKLQGDSYLPF